MVISTEFGVPAVTDEGSLPVSSATVKVSSSVSGSCAVVTVPVPLLAPPAMVMDDSVPWSPDSAVPGVTVTGTATALDRVLESVAVTVTEAPSSTGFGDADSDTAAGGWRGGCVTSLP